MFSFLLLQICGFFFNYFFSATGNGVELLPRYVVEDGFKSAIFGSYSYDPLSDAFEQDQGLNGHESKQSISYTTTTEPTTDITTTESKNTSLFKLRHIVRRENVKSKYIT